MPTFQFKETHSISQRTEESERVLQKFPERVPLIVERAESCSLDDVDKNKFLAPSDLSVGQFIYTIRSRMRLDPTTALFLFVVSDGVSKIPPTSMLLGTLYAENRDEDGFLYILYHSENTFGNNDATR